MLALTRHPPGPSYKASLRTSHSQNFHSSPLSLFPCTFPSILINHPFVQIPSFFSSIMSSALSINTMFNPTEITVNRCRSPSPFICSLTDYSHLDPSLHLNNTTLQFITIFQFNTILHSISLVFFPETQHHYHHAERPKQKFQPGNPRAALQGPGSAPLRRKRPPLQLAFEDPPFQVLLVRDNFELIVTLFWGFNPGFESSFAIGAIPSSILGQLASYINRLCRSFVHLIRHHINVHGLQPNCSVSLEVPNTLSPLTLILPI